MIIFWFWYTVLFPSNCFLEMMNGVIIVSCIGKGHPCITERMGDLWALAAEQLGPQVEGSPECLGGRGDVSPGAVMMPNPDQQQSRESSRDAGGARQFQDALGMGKGLTASSEVLAFPAVVESVAGELQRDSQVSIPLFFRQPRPQMTH